VELIVNCLIFIELGDFSLGIFKKLFLDELVVHGVCLGAFLGNGRTEVACFFVVASLRDESVVFVS
jgi:hypothetical protein